MADKNFKVKHGFAMGDGVLKFDAETSTWQLSIDGVNFSTVASASTTLDGLSDVSVSAALAGDFLKWNGTAWVPSIITLGTDTAGNYMSGVTQGTGVTITHTPGEGSNATIAIGQAVGTSSSVTFAHVSAPVTGNVTGDVTGNSGTATALQNARTISLGGDLSGSASFNGTSDVTITATVQPNSVALGADTTGNYMSDLTQGTGVTITHTPGEGSNATIAIGQAVGTSSSVTFAAVTAPLVGNASTATTLQNARAISLGGDLSGSASFDGSTDITITAEVQPNSVALGTDTTGNYVSDVTAGTGVSVTHTPGEGSSPTIAIGQAVGTSASVQFAQITTTGNVTIGGDLTVNGTTTTVNTETINLADNIIVLNSNETSTPSQNAGIEIERGSATNVALRWNEANDKWELTTDGTNYNNIATEDYAASLTPSSLDDIGDVTISSASAGHFLAWSGTEWVNKYPTSRVSDSLPSNPEQGQIWYESDTGKTFIYYDSFWVEVTGATGAAGADGIVQDCGYESGEYYGPPGVTATTGVLATSRTYYASFYIGKTTTFDRIGCSTGAGFVGTAVVRLGVYNNDDATGKPSTVKFDAGTFSVTSVNTTSAITINETLTKGWYWTAVNMQTAASTSQFRVSGPFQQSPFLVSTNDNMNSRPSYYQDGVTGAFATTGTLVRQGNVIPIAMLRVA